MILVLLLILVNTAWAEIITINDPVPVVVDIKPGDLNTEIKPVPVKTDMNITLRYDDRLREYPGNITYSENQTDYPVNGTVVMKGTEMNTTLTRKANSTMLLDDNLPQKQQDYSAPMRVYTLDHPESVNAIDPDEVPEEGKAIPVKPVRAPIPVLSWIKAVLVNLFS